MKQQTERLIGLALLCIIILQLARSAAADTLLPVVATDCRDMAAGIVEVTPGEGGFFRAITPLTQMCGEPLIFVTALGDNAPAGLESVETLAVGDEWLVSGRVDVARYPVGVGLRLQWLAVVP